MICEYCSREIGPLCGHGFSCPKKEITMLTEKPVLKSIAEQTVLLKVSFGMLGNSRKVPTSILKGGEGDKKKILKIHKVLFESPELKAIQNADQQMRAYLYNVSMPFDAPLMLVPLGEDGAYLQTVHQTILNYAVERAELVEKFLDVYPQLVEDSHDRMIELSAELGVPLEVLWNPADYPDLDGAKAQFTFDFAYHSFAVPDALKLAKIYDEAKDAAESKINQAAEQITILMRQTFLDLINKLKDALEPTADGKSKRLYSANIKNIQEFIAEFKDKNIVNDSELENLVNNVSLLVDPSLSMETLKSDDGFKTTVHDQLEGFAYQLKSLVEVIPGRKFKDI